MERPRPRLLRVLATALAASALIAGGVRAPAAFASTPTPLPLETDGQGVHLVQRDRPREMVLTFDASAAAGYRQIAGRMFEINCVRFARRSDHVEIMGGGEANQTAPRRRRPIVIHFQLRFDYCSIGVQHGRRTTILTRIALTPLGAVRLDERNTASTVIAAVHLLGRAERPSAAQVAARLHGVALDSPDEAPPPGTLGVYSDGAAHVYAAQADRAGTLLFVEEDGDVTRTNVTDYLTEPELLRQ